MSRTKCWKCEIYENQNENREETRVLFCLTRNMSQNVVGRSLWARQLLQVWAGHGIAVTVGGVKVKPTWNDLLMAWQIILAQVGVSVSSLFSGHRTKGYMTETCTFLAFFPTQVPKPGFTLSWEVLVQTPRGEWRALRRQGQDLALRPACPRQLSGAGRCDTGGWGHPIFLWCSRWS